MRLRLTPGPLPPGAPALVLTLVLAGPASAQVQQSNPNAANQSFAIQSQFRSLQQQQISNYNILNMQAQRNVQFSPSPVYPGAYGIVGRPKHRGGRAHRGMNTSICTGC